MIEREWLIAPPHPLRERLAQDARVSPLIAQLLLLRGITEPQHVAPFLAPDFKRLLPPEALPGTSEASERLHAAIRTGRKIVIYGDYDVDGITATAMLWQVLHLAGAKVDYYIPSRLEEGYGLNADALRAIAADGGQVVVTVDCGVTAVEAVAAGREAGLEIIITDHHQPQAALPDAHAIVHPTALGASENPHLSGAGVALKVAWAIAQRVSGGGRVAPLFKDALIDATAFAALGLIADIVPLVGENREIASFGLRQINKSQNAGLRALVEVSGLADRKQVSDYEVGFLLAPRLNAIGRLGHARLAVDLFTRASAEHAREIATNLDELNRKRQQVEREIASEAQAQVTQRGFDRESCRGIVLASRTWHAGVIGIVASRIVEQFHRPTFLIRLEGEQGQGSGRSVRNFPLHEVLECCGEHLTSFGGHAMAAGVRLQASRLEAFTEAFQREAANRLTPADLRPRLRLDDEVALGELSLEAVDAIAKLAPFGDGNPRPRLATQPVELVESPRTVGSNGTHLQFVVRDGRTQRKAIAFGRGAEAEAISDARRIRLAFEPILNEWNGRRSVELKVFDWKPAE